MRNVSVKVFDGTYGWREHAPYDAIVVAAAAPDIPAPLVSQLSATGRLVVPVGPANRQRLLVVKMLPSGRTRTEDAGDVAYVPLVGKKTRFVPSTDRVPDSRISVSPPGFWS